MHEFPKFGEPITALAASPAVDVIAVGFMSGSIVLYHLREATVVMALRQTGRVTAIAFRTGTDRARCTVRARAAAANAWPCFSARPPLPRTSHPARDCLVVRLLAPAPPPPPRR